MVEADQIWPGHAKPCEQRCQGPEPGQVPGTGSGHPADPGLIQSKSCAEQELV